MLNCHLKVSRILNLTDFLYGNSPCPGFGISRCLKLIHMPYNSPDLIDSLDSRAENSFHDAVKKLQDSLPKSLRKYLKDIKYPDFDSIESIHLRAAELGEVLDSFIRSRELYKQDQNILMKGKAIVQKWYRATYPFAQLFVTLAQKATSAVSVSFGSLIRLYRSQY